MAIAVIAGTQLAALATVSSTAIHNDPASSARHSAGGSAAQVAGDRG